MRTATTYHRFLTIPAFVLILALVCGSILQAQSNLYVTVYYPTWMFRSHSSPTWYAVPPWDMKFTGVTHIIQFGNPNVTTTYPYFTPMTSDSLEWAFGTQSNGESNRTFYRDSLVTIAHRQGAKVLICIQQAQDGSPLYSITSDSGTTDSFAAAVAGYVHRHNYDGVDVNWETSIGNKTQTSLLFRRLRARLGSTSVISISPLSGGWDNYDAATCNAYVNQINPQEYDISDAWNGCISQNGNWPINALHQGATTNCSGTNQQAYDSRGPVQWEEQGFRPSILGIGIASFGRMYVGSKVIGGAHPISRQDVCSFYTGNQLLATGGGVLVQDAVRNVEYIVGTAPSNFNYRSCSVAAGQDYFFTYQTPAVIPGQVNWVKQNGFGGIMVYDFQGDCDNASGYGQTNPIINAIVTAVGNGPQVPDSIKPVIVLTEPLDGSAVSGPVTVSATATDNIGVARVDFLIDGSVATTDYAAPYTFTWNAAKIRGSHTIVARAFDPAGNLENSLAATVSVIAPPSDSIPFPAVLRDDFNTPNPPLPGRLKWSPLLNARLNGSMQIAGGQLQPTADPGTYPNGGMAWDTLMGPGTEESITVTQKSGDFSETSLYLYAKMDGTDYLTGSGYRLRYWEKSGADLFAIQIVGPGYGVYYDLGAGSSANYELQPGDEVTFRILSDNKTMIGFVNGVELVRAVDSTYMPQQWYFSMLGGVFSQPVQFDDFKVSSRDTPVTPKIQGTVFFDQNNNGVRDSTEPGMSGWTVRVDGPASASTVTDSSGSYSFERLPLGSYTVTELNREAWTHTLPSGTGAYNLTITNPSSITNRDIGNFSPIVVGAQIEKGWRLLSVPVLLSDRRLQSIFPTASSPAYSFHRIYVSQDPLGYGDGYWLRFPQGQTLWTAGSDLVSDTAHVTAGWNLIGSISHPVAVGQVSSDPPGIIASMFWRYWETYNVADSLQPGFGYWVKVSQDGSVILSAHQGGAISQPLKSSPEELAQMNALHFTDGTSDNRVLYFSQKPAGKELQDEFELPPTPPAGVFDARFLLPREGSEGASAVFSVGTGNTLMRVPILLASVTYPLRISWTLSSSGAHFRLRTNDGTLHELTTSGEFTLSDPGSDQEQGPLTLTLEISNDATAPLPSEYELSQNYPNPFNNGTVIHLSLPSDAYVRLNVFNVLGEAITTLVDRQMEAGRHTIPFDATSLPSGIYFYKVDVSGPSNEVYSKVLRMTLLK